MNITQLLNNNCFPGRNGFKPKWLVLHGTAGGTSAQEIAQFFKGTENGSNPVSAHYIVDEQGIIYQATLESDGAYANGVVTAGHEPWWNADGNPNPNNVTISVEHVKPDDANATALTPAQQSASFALIRDICQRNNIPTRWADSSGGITGHYSIDPVNRSRCPGTYPWAELYNYLDGGNQPMPPTQPSANQIKAARDSWYSALKSTVAGPAPTGSGIYQAWLAALITGKFYGPPITREYDSVDWAGNPIVAQEFAHAR